MATYLATQNAGQRTRLLCAAKFPKKVEVAAYSQVRRPLQKALTKPDFDATGLSSLADMLSAKARREVGYQKDEALRCERAVRAFMSTMTPRLFKRVRITAAPAPLVMQVAKVTLRIPLDASIIAEADGVANSGGIVLFYAFNADEISHRLTAAAGLVLWALEAGQMEPLPRLCMAAHIAKGTIVRASPAHTRFRRQIDDSCAEIAARWPSVGPPADYDGPVWQ